MSNWWGAIFIPLAAYLSLNSIKKRINFELDVTNQSIKKQFLLPFIVAFLYAVVIAVSFSSGNAQISGVLFQALFIIALFFPIYQAAYFLGFVLGLTYTFGGVLPIIIGLFLGGISYLLFHFIRPGFKWLATKLGVLKTHP